MLVVWCVRLWIIDDWLSMHVYECLHVCFDKEVCVCGCACLWFLQDWLYNEVCETHVCGHYTACLFSWLLCHVVGVSHPSLSCQYGQFEWVSYLTEDVQLGRQWLKQMGAAADKSGIAIQYCMSYGYDTCACRLCRNCVRRS